MTHVSLSTAYKKTCTLNSVLHFLSGLVGLAIIGVVFYAVINSVAMEDARYTVAGFSLLVVGLPTTFLFWMSAKCLTWKIPGKESDVRIYLRRMGTTGPSCLLVLGIFWSMLHFELL